MRKFFLIALLPLFCSALAPLSDEDLVTIGEPTDHSEQLLMQAIQEQYQELGIEDVVCFDAFYKAYEGYYKIPQTNKTILTLIDFSKPSNQPRLAVIDMEKCMVLFTSLVAHGRNSGEMYATDFSNTNGSYKSSLGFYLTGSTYMGSNGYSLKLIGLEKGFNDNALERAIVMHGAKYCDPSIVSGGARLGRSLGCPALPPQVSGPIIDAIKDGSLLFIYASDRSYLSNSPIVGRKKTYLTTT